MSHYDFILLCKPFSVNAYYYRDQRIKTKEARAWEAHILELLEEHRKPLLDCIAKFSSEAVFAIEMTAIYPRHVFYNQSGGVSSKTIDVTNFEKPLLDMIFKHILQLNDKYVVKCTSKKEPGASYALAIKLKLYSKR